MKNYYMRSLMTSIVWAFCLSIEAQVPKSADSLALYLKKAIRDTNYVAALNAYSWKQIEVANYQLVDSLAKEAEKLAQKLKFITGEYDSYDVRGRAWYVQSDYAKAQEYYQKCYQIAQKYPVGVAYKQEALANLGMIKHLTGKNEEALKLILESIRIYETHQLPKLSGSPYDVAASIFNIQGKAELALQYFKQSLAIKTKENNLRGMATTNNRIGGLLAQMGNKKASLPYLKAAEKYAEQANYQMVLPDILVNLSSVYRDLKQPEQDLQALEKAEKIAQKLNSTHMLGVIYGNLGQYYQTQKQYTLAEKYLREGLAIFKEVGSLEYEGYLYQALTELFVEKGDYKKAYENSLTAKAVSDSLFSVQQKARMDEMEAKFETGRKEQQIRLLQQESIIKNQELTQSRTWLGIGVLVLLLGGLLTAWLLNRAKVRRLEESLQMRNKIAADLHDEIGSTLSSISLLSGLTEKQLINNQPQKAEQLIHKISQDSRQILESMDDIVWTINPRNDSMSNLLVRLREYAKPLAESKGVDLKFDIQPDVENLTLAINVRQNVYLIVKEAINNLFKYAQATQAEVEWSKNGKVLQVVVRDNGVGFDPHLVSSRNGLKNMRERALSMKGDLQILSSVHEGSAISLTVAV
jgi:two-component system, NarL family, sensor histidine kinase UhpB